MIRGRIIILFLLCLPLGFLLASLPISFWAQYALGMGLIAVLVPIGLFWSAGITWTELRTAWRTRHSRRL